MKKIKTKIKTKINFQNLEAKKLLRNKRVIEEINRHKWLESEIAGYDIGFEAAAEDWLKKHAAVWIAYHDGKKSKSLTGSNSDTHTTSTKKEAKTKVNSNSLINISEFPESIQPVISEFAKKLIENFEDNIHAILVYGSAAGINYNHGVSNINIAVIFKNLDFNVLCQSLNLLNGAVNIKFPLRYA